MIPTYSTGEKFYNTKFFILDNKFSFKIVPFLITRYTFYKLYQRTCITCELIFNQREEDGTGLCVNNRRETGLQSRILGSC